MLFRTSQRANCGAMVILGTNVSVADMLPEDGKAHGFDNVGAALDLSPVQLQRYIEAAGIALDAAVNFGPQPAAKVHELRFDTAAMRRISASIGIAVRTARSSSFWKGASRQSNRRTSDSCHRPLSGAPPCRGASFREADHLRRSFWKGHARIARGLSFVSRSPARRYSRGRIRCRPPQWQHGSLVCIRTR